MANIIVSHLKTVMLTQQLYLIHASLHQHYDYFYFMNYIGPNSIQRYDEYFSISFTQLLFLKHLSCLWYDVTVLLLYTPERTAIVCVDSNGEKSDNEVCNPSFEGKKSNNSDSFTETTVKGKPPVPIPEEVVGNEFDLSSGSDETTTDFSSKLGGKGPLAGKSLPVFAQPTTPPATSFLSGGI